MKKTWIFFQFFQLSAFLLLPFSPPSITLVPLDTCYYWFIGDYQRLIIICAWNFISVRFPLKKPVGECLKGFHVSSIMFLSKLKQHRPCKIRVYPWCQIIHQFTWWTNHLITFWTQKESKRFSCGLAVHHCPMQATLVSPIWKCLINRRKKNKFDINTWTQIQAHCLVW